MKPALPTHEILDTLRELHAGLTAPLWLSGGVAVDFLVGRWTRPHGDIDLCTFEQYRPALAQELPRLGYHTNETGWLTQWYQQGSGRRLEIIFLEWDANGAPELHIHPGDPLGVAGHYPTAPDYLDPLRTAELEGVRFRVCSPAGEWLARAGSVDVVGTRQRDPKLDHDQHLLESLFTADELAALRALLAARQAAR